MATTWRKAPDYILDIAKRLIHTKPYLERLQEARIAIILRSEAGKSGGRKILGRAAKVPEQNRLFMDYDFLVWLAEDELSLLSAHQREALIAHELLHCSFVGGSPKIRPHDVEEFEIIIRDFGIWWPDSDSFAVAVQAALPLTLPEPEAPRGTVGTIDFGKLMEDVAAEMRAEGFDVEHVPAGAMDE